MTIKKPFNIRALPALASMLVLGILVGCFASKIVMIVTAIIAIIFVITAVCIPKIKSKVLLILCCISLGVGMGVSAIHISTFKAMSAPTQATISGTIDSDNHFVEKGELVLDGKKYIVLDNVTMNGKAYKGKVKFHLDIPHESKWYVGDRMTTIADVDKVRLVTTDNYTVSDYTDGIRWIAYMVVNEDIENPILITKDSLSLSDKTKLYIKNTLLKWTDKNTAEFLYAMTFGNSQGMDKSIKTAFSVTGTAHLFAVSGLHVGIVAAAILGLMSLCKIKDPYKSAICIGFLLFFCYLSGWSPSTIRATIMIAVLTLSKMTGLRNDSLTTLAFSAIVLLLVQPMWLLDLGFLMSFGAVLGIILLSKPLGRLFGKMPKCIASPMSLCISANMGIMPIMLMYFGDVSLVCVLVNLMILPVITILFPIYLLVVLISGLVAPVGWILSGIGYVFGLVIKLVQLTTPLSVMRISLPTAWYVILPYLAFLFVVSDYCLWEKKFRTVVASVVCVVMLASSVLSLTSVFGYDMAIESFSTTKYHNYALIHTKHEDILLVQNKLDGQAMMKCKELMDKYSLRDIDRIVIADDSRYEKSDFKYLENNAKKLGCDIVHSRLGIYQEMDLTCSESERIGDILIDLSMPKTAEITLGKLTIVSTGLQSLDTWCDIVLAPPDNFESKEGQICIDSVRYALQKQNYVPSQFTFRVKDDKIIKNYAWSVQNR